MAKVTNTDRRAPRGIAGVTIPPGATREVPDFERVRNKPVIAGWVRAGLLIVEGAVEAAAGASLDLELTEKQRLIDQLAILGVKRTTRASLETLQKALAEAKGGK